MATADIIVGFMSQQVLWIIGFSLMVYFRKLNITYVSP